MRRFAAAVWLSLFAVLGSACSDDPMSTPLPCDVDAVLESECRLCHNANLDFGAPMALEDWEDTQEMAPTDASKRVWEAMQARINGMGTPMPPNGIGNFDMDDRAVLNAWFQADTPPGDGQCE